jgi:hypothetical protein
VAIRWKATVGAALLLSGLLGASVASAAPLPGPQAGGPGSQWDFSLPSYESSVCGAPGAGFATCHAIQLSTPTQYWHPGPSWPGPRHSFRGGTGNAPVASTPAPPGSGYYPVDLQSAYGLAQAASNMTPGSTAPTVAIVDAYDDPNASSDLNAYRNSMSGAQDPQTGLTDSSIPPVCSASVTTGCSTFTKVNQSGGTSYPPGSSGWAEEISLDLDMVSAICPDCNIVLVEANSSSIANLAAAVQEAASFHPAAISNSYGGSEFSTETSLNSVYSAGTATAITAATGDSGYGAEFPAVSPGVTAVGGTTLSYTGTGSSLAWSPQTVWSGAGSGCSLYEAMPSWQADAGVYSLSADCGFREVADVSADANPQTGVAAYDTYGQSGWLVFGGTSVSTQIIGATYALAAAHGTIQPSPAALYPDGSDNATGSTPGLVPVDSVNAGSNGSCGNYLCNAGDSLTSGFNGPTGLGTPYGLSAFSTSATTSSSLSFSPTSEALRTGVASGAITVNLSVVPTTSLTVTVATTSAGGEFSSSPGGPFSPGPLTLTIGAGSTTSAPFYYEDTVVGNPTVSASAPGWTGATMPTSVVSATQPGLSVAVAAGGVSGRRGLYQVPLTVTADNASSGTGVGQASVSLQVFAGSQCSGTVAASGSGTTSSNGRAGFTFTSRSAETWCALATVTASGYSSGSGQTTFGT